MCCMIVRGGDDEGSCRRMEAGKPGRYPRDLRSERRRKLRRPHRDFDSLDSIDSFWFEEFGDYCLSGLL